MRFREQERMAADIQSYQKAQDSVAELTTLQSANEELQKELALQRAALAQMSQAGTASSSAEVQRLREELDEKSQELALVQAEAELAADVMREESEKRIVQLQSELGEALASKPQAGAIAKTHSEPAELLTEQLSRRVLVKTTVTPAARPPPTASPREPGDAECATRSADSGRSQGSSKEEDG